MNLCLFCGGDSSEPNHRLQCDGRQGQREADLEQPPIVVIHVASGLQRKQERYRRALAVYQQTSRDAWEGFEPYTTPTDAAILSVIHGREDGATCFEIEAATGFKHQTVSAQLRHMVEGGLLEANGETRANAGGRQSMVWIICGTMTTAGR